LAGAFVAAFFAVFAAAFFAAFAIINRIYGLVKMGFMLTKLLLSVKRS
jgi:hypothetical protein